MRLTAGMRLGAYSIVGPLGAGGMGEVYRARDSRLDRDVAIKVLPESFSSNPERVARFTREAKTLAALNHPNIAVVHGFEEIDGIRLLVMELVEGTTLAERITRGPVPVSLSLATAVQVARALEAAHAKGVVHRDLKPGNVVLTPRGVAKVLDFGLAKVGPLLDEPAPSATTATTWAEQGPVTGAGALVGTAPYISPEQARGDQVDKRADIWAFGCVLYEMLTRRRAFDGATLSDTIAAILEREPDWNRLPAALPAGITRVLHRCLQKNAEQRFHDMADVRIEIEEAQDEPRRSEPPPRRGVTAARAAWYAIAGAVGIALIIGLARSDEAPAEIRLDVATPETNQPSSFALSPDGRTLAYVANDSRGEPALWLRGMSADRGRMLEGTQGAHFPFWSPDGRSIGFFSTGDSRLKRIDVEGGSPVPLAGASPGVGGTWGTGGDVLFAGTLSSPLLRVPSTGGNAMAVTTLAVGQTSHRFPQFLPDGRRFLFYSTGTADVQGIYLGSLGSDETIRLTQADAAGSYVPPGWLLFVRQNRLVAQRLDRAARALVGEPVPVADRLELSPQLLAPSFSASHGGPIAYRTAVTDTRQLRWFDRSGKPLGTLGAPFRDDLLDPELSPDGARVAATRRVDGNTDVWILEGDRPRRLTSSAGTDIAPVWSPDGSRLAFSSDATGALDAYVVTATVTGEPELVHQSPMRKTLNDWSSDGRFILVHEVSPTGPDIWAIPLHGDRSPVAVATSAFVEVWGQFSPDGRWVVYQSNETGPWEIYVRPFPGPGGSHPVSVAGGIYPRWRSDGRELYYLAPDSTLMAVAIAAAASGLDIATPVPLFKPPILGGGTNVIGRGPQYDVAPDGRLLINISEGAAISPPITVILNWQPPRSSSGLCLFDVCL